MYTQQQQKDTHGGKKTLAGALNPGISLANIRHLMHAAHCKQTTLWGGAHY